MGEQFSTTLEWQGTVEIGQRLASLVPEGVECEIVENEGVVTLTIIVQATNLEELREVVDGLLTTFSDHDQ